METKPGYLTTEFWAMILINVLPELGAIDVGGAKVKAILHAVTVTGYAISRGFAKFGVKPDTTSNTARELPKILEAFNTATNIMPDGDNSTIAPSNIAPPPPAPVPPVGL